MSKDSRKISDRKYYLANKEKINRRKKSNNVGQLRLFG